ncbi:polysaccharide deacetylase family protein [uncultured Draconibacterium sp.]|uniref:polysaccharide deacetylase family protein n=1 Tax=uncultured Draconibacterium sp. TaxID=1573823 RepID=UPI0029C8F474|nr:polysaccharide deacetylase family protein [uncultured Draconibacterium sp.]
MKRKSVVGRVLQKLVLVLIGCSALLDCQKSKQQGAVVYSFDDQYIDEWYKQRDLFNQYNIKATFFINRPQNLSSEQLEKLKQLEADGHEIGCHGLNHRNVVDFKDSLDVLINSEIKPAIKILADYGFEICSFAHPFGKSLPEIDTLLLSQFQYLRKATYNIKDTTIDFYDDIFATKDNYQITNSMGIDTNYKISLQNFETGILRAKANNEVLILHAHRVDSSLTNYSVSPEYLEETFKLCREHNIESIRISDLETFFTGN